VPGSLGLGAGGVEGVGHAVVLAGLPDDRVAVVLAAVVDGHPDAQGEGGLALGDVVVAEAVGAVGEDARWPVDGGMPPSTPSGHGLHQPTVAGCQDRSSSWPLVGEVRLATWVPSACITYRLDGPPRLLPKAILVPSGE
jgi:hypothetical protein